MRIDMHFHVVGDGKDIRNTDNDVYLNLDDNHHWFTRILSNLVEEDLKQMGADFNQDGKISTREYINLAIKLLESSEEIDGIVLLAVDAVYTPRKGTLDEIKTDLWVSNRFLNQTVTALNERLAPALPDKKFFFGASVSPNRKDWEAELEYVLNQTEAVLVKLIPSTQHINLKDVKHKEFFKTLARHNMPLLCHVGPEYSFPEGIRQRQLDNFRHLEMPLECGVTVIAAHCATPVFPVIDRNDIQAFHTFMKEANGDGKVRLWGDTSALSLSTRITFVPEIVERFPSAWLVHGSDFPIPIDGWPHLPFFTYDMTPEEYIRIRRTDNPLDRDVRIKQAHGFADSILENAEKVLRMPKS
jgi:predicted TIM-barrel fold metal-dependent hydrolase